MAMKDLNRKNRIPKAKRNRESLEGYRADSLRGYCEYHGLSYTLGRKLHFINAILESYGIDDLELRALVKSEIEEKARRDAAEEEARSLRREEIKKRQVEEAKRWKAQREEDLRLYPDEDPGFYDAHDYAFAVLKANRQNRSVIQAIKTMSPGFTDKAIWDVANWLGGEYRRLIFREAYRDGILKSKNRHYRR